MQWRRWPGPLFYGVILLVLAVDQITKVWALDSLRTVGTVSLLPGFLNLTFVRNTGIAFGLFSGQGWIIALFMTALAALALFFTRGLNWRGWEPNLVGGCLVGGALGNMLDRSRLGYVVDFFDVYVGTHHWPVFNVADSLICLAVGWIVIRQLRSADESVKARPR